MNADDREKVARAVREGLETNAAASLAELQAQVTADLSLDRSPSAQRELGAFIRELCDEFQRKNEFDYDDVVEQSFPASDPPPPPAPASPPAG